MVCQTVKKANFLNKNGNLLFIKKFSIRDTLYPLIKRSDIHRRRAILLYKMQIKGASKKILLQIKEKKKTP